MPLPAALAAGSDQTGAGSGAVDPAAPPAGWRHTVEQGADTYLKGDERAEEAVVMTREVPASTSAEVDAVTARLFPALGCKRPPPASRDGSVEPFGDGSIGPFGKASRCFAASARSTGGYRIAIGAAINPQAEGEAIALARRLAGAGAAPAASAARQSAAGPEVDAVAMDAALAAALDAVPKRNLPIHMTLRRGFRYNGDNIVLDYKLWMLFAGGFATSCTRWDPAVRAPTAESLASLIEETSCKATRWRPVAGGAVFDDEPKGGPAPLEDGPPPVRGTTYDGDFGSSSVAFSSLMTYGVPGQLVIDSDAVSFSQDGRFRLGSERLNRTNLDRTTTRQPMREGRYMVDRYLIAIVANGKIERHFFYALGKPTDKDLLFYFDGTLMSRK